MIEISLSWDGIKELHQLLMLLREVQDKGTGSMSLPGCESTVTWNGGGVIIRIPQKEG